MNQDALDRLRGPFCRCVLDLVEVVELYPRETACVCCGVPLVVSRRGPSFGIPCYEDLVLPNGTPRTPYGEIIREWDGSGWGGFDACEVCHGEQARLDDVVTLSELRDLAAGARLAAFLDAWVPR